MPNHRRHPFQLTDATPPSTEAIQILAYKFWEIGGRRNGHALDDWLLAEAILTPGMPLPIDDDDDWRE
jgi:hypothetical protein